ncbi:MAG: hypothetical protein FJX74_15530 [Armatimonadetes bacterium]|nr:hypothetical protein [Armatimonadota bacterium]
MLALAMLAAVGTCQTASLSEGSLVVSVGAQTLTVSLTDAGLRLDSPHGSRTLEPSLQLGDGWTRPSPVEAQPIVTERDGSLRARVVYPVPEQRRFALEVEACSGLDAVFVTSRLEVLDSARGQYYFWQTNVSSDRLLSPTPSGFEEAGLDTAAWAPLPWREWWFLPGETGGLAVLPTNIGGRAPGAAGGVFLHALPRSAVIAPGDSLDAGFGLAMLPDAASAAALWAVARARPAALEPGTPPAQDYGRPAPRWLRDAEVYNLYYRPAAQWTDEVVEGQLRGFPFIIGSTPDRAALERCHTAGVRLLHYVTYTCLLDTVQQARDGGTVYSEWTESIDCESRDLAYHPDWVCIDAEGKAQHDAWGLSFKHPWLLNTCLHQPGLREAAIRQVRMLMDLGFDGVFVDLAGPTVECYGPKFGKHAHRDERTNTQAWEDLLREIYAEVKRHGPERVVIQNTCVSIMPSHWPSCDAQMLESFPYGADSTELRQPWPELQWTARRNAAAVENGKVVVTCPYFGPGDLAPTQRAATFSLAYAQLAGFLWADAFGLRDIEGNGGFAQALYATRLGRPTSPLTRQGPAVLRAFERGSVALNPMPWPARMGHDAATVELPPQSARITARGAP